MERDEGRWPAYGSQEDQTAWDDDGAGPAAWDAPWDGRVTNEDFVDPPRPQIRDEARGEAARPLYDGRPVRDPYDRGGGYRRASDAVWARAGADYLDGDSAETVCARHGLAVSTFRQRARDNGWRRIDQPDPEPIDLEAEEAAGLPDYAEMARCALVRLNRAVRAGRAAEAGGWMRLHTRLLDLARAAEATAPVSGPESGPKSGPEPGPGPGPQPEPRPASAPGPVRRPDPRAAALAQARTVQTLVRAVSGLRADDPVGRRLMDKGLEILDALDRASISDDSDGSDGVFSGRASEGPAGPGAPP